MHFKSNYGGFFVCVTKQPADNNNTVQGLSLLASWMCQPHNIFE